MPRSKPADFLKLHTPLKPGMLILDKLEGTEEISKPFCFELTMHSKESALDLSLLIGKVFTAGFHVAGIARYFSGIVGEIHQGATYIDKHHRITEYIAKIYPKFWTLQFVRDYRIFQQMSAIDIIKKIFTENGIVDIKDRTAAGKIREYCVQYGETAFDFCSRLMEEEGIFYFFTHDKSKHTMVLSKVSYSAKPVSPNAIPLTFITFDDHPFNRVHSFFLQQKVGVNKYATADYNFTTANLALHNKAQAKDPGTAVKGTFYEYPGHYKLSEEGDQIANRCLEEFEWVQKTAEGLSTVPLFCPMSSFRLSKHPRKSANQEYILHRVYHLLYRSPPQTPIASQQHFAKYQGEYEWPPKTSYVNIFHAFPKSVPFRPLRQTAKARIYGTQTAIVTAPKGEEIFCDEYGRIKVKFHWDKQGSNDEKSSCWIRVAQLWAGSNWGGVFTPRKGMEVVVTFLDGDPDQPLITGSVYNSANMPPYVKKEPTQSAIKSYSSKAGGGYNEIRLEDKKGKEQLFLHAQKDLSIVAIGSRATVIGKGAAETDISNRLDGSDTLILKKGDRSEHLIKGNYNTAIDTGNRSITLTKGNYILTMANGNLTLTITGNINIKSTETITIQSGQNINFNCGGSFKIKAAQGISLTSSAQVSVKGSTIGVEAAAQTSIKGGASVSIQGGITQIQGGIVKIN